jgi:hypothetical protein
MKKHLFNLFFPHHGNNHRAKLLHHKSLSKIILLLLLSQFVITFLTTAKPGVLGYASNITVSDIVSLSNKERESTGLTPLKFNDSLADSARRKAAHMFANNYWAHNGPDGTSPWVFFKEAKYNYLYAGENLARDFNDSQAVVKAWMESPTHKDNLLSGRYDEIGVAVVNGILSGQETTLVVQHFGKQSEVIAQVSNEAAKSIATNNPKITIENIKPGQKPEIALQETVEEMVEDLEKNSPESAVLPAGTSNKFKSSPIIPIFSAFNLTKSINLAITAIILIVLVTDGIHILRTKSERRAGKNFIHLTLFVIVALIILLTKNGRII